VPEVVRELAKAAPSARLLVRKRPGRVSERLLEPDLVVEDADADPYRAGRAGLAGAPSRGLARWEREVDRLLQQQSR
jgi:hypothetical protein